MDLFIEKEFIEEFELDYEYAVHQTEIQHILYSLFTEFPSIRLYLNTSESFIDESRILSLFSDTNTDIKPDIDFEDHFKKHLAPFYQTMIFSKNEKKWFQDLRNNGVLCFSYSNYEQEIKSFIQETTFKVDLSDPEQIPFDWKYFHFIKSKSNFLILTDPYILNNTTSQKIIKNLIPLLKENLNKSSSYSIFIITETDGDADNKIRQIYSALREYKIKVYLINRIKQVEQMVLHDRHLYSNYTMASCGIGFNLNLRKPVNGILENASLFEKFTYKCYCNHLKALRIYMDKLEKYKHHKNPYKTNTIESFAAFREISRCMLSS